MKKLFVGEPQNYLKICFVLLMLCGCEKDASILNEDLVKNAKEWYIKAHGKDLSAIRSSDQAVNNISMVPLWDKGVVITLPDGASVVSCPLRTILNNKPFSNGSFMLLISVGRGKVDQDKFDSRIIYSEDGRSNNNSGAVIKNLYKSAFNQSNKTRIYNTSGAAPQKNSALLATINPAGAHGVSKLNEQESGCTNWYLVTSYYDENGFFLYSEEQYLYSSGCTQDLSGPGLGVAQNDNQDCSATQAVIQGKTVSENINSAIIESTATTRTKSYVWKFLENSFGMWSYNSIEEGIHKKVSGVWQWKSLTHKSIARNGMALGASISVIITSDIPVVGMYYAGMQLTFEFKAEAVCKGFPFSTYYAEAVNSPVWSVSN